MAATWDAVQTMLGKIWTRLEVIDKLAEAQGKLCQRLDELEKALGRLDPNASASDAKTPSLTAVYDPITKGVKLITMDQYQRHYAKIPLPSYVAIYNPDKQCVDLMYEKHYKEGAHYAADLKARKPRPIPEYTCVYNEESQEIKLELWEKYVQAHHPPRPDFGLKYNSKIQGVELVFWRNYVPGAGYSILSVNDFF